MKLKFSDYDRCLVATAQRDVPWVGTEEIVLARFELGEALQLEKFKVTHGATLIDQLSREPTFTADLSRANVELLVTLVAGGGGQIRGELGPAVGALIARIRKVAPRLSAPPKGEAPPP